MLPHAPRAQPYGHRADRLNVLTDKVRRHHRNLIQPLVRDAHHQLDVFSGRACPKSLPKCRNSHVDGVRLSGVQKADAPFSHELRRGTER